MGEFVLFAAEQGIESDSEHLPDLGYPENSSRFVTLNLLDVIDAYHYSLCLTGVGVPIFCVKIRA